MFAKLEFDNVQKIMAMMWNPSKYKIIVPSEFFPQ